MKLRALLNEIILFEISLDQIKAQFVDTGKLSPQDFEQIKDASGGEGAYATWLTARVVGSKKQKPLIKSEDIYKYKNYLRIFKSKRKEFPFTDINQIKSPQDLSQFISTAVDLRNQEEEDPSKIKGVSKQEKYSKFKIGEVDGFTVYKIPKNSPDYNVSCELGSGTEWCTATGKTKTYFKKYIKKGPLYIFDNGRGEKYQFHYESASFMDKNDRSIRILNHINFFKYLEDIGEKNVPIKIKLLNPKEFGITPEDLKVPSNLDFWVDGREITSLPDNLEVEGNLGLRDTKIKSLPNNLKVGDNLNLEGTQIKSLPNNLKVGGNLNLEGTQIKSLPDDLEVGGTIRLQGTQVTSFPDNFKINGGLDLKGTKVKSLPKNLKIGKKLYLDGTQINSLPDNLEVGGDLNLSNTSITSFPKNLKVGGNLYLVNTPFSSKTQAEVRPMVPGVKGAIYGLKDFPSEDELDRVYGKFNK
jgi:hypothetical protein